MPKRFCIERLPDGTLCTTIHDGPTERCPSHQELATKRRNARPSSSSRGLGWEFSRRKKADPAYQAATRCQCRGCPRCGDGCGVAFTKSNPKTAGHTIPRSQGGGSSAILAVCRSCNSADGGRLAHRG